MKNSGHNTKIDRSLLPSPVGYQEKRPTLCIGLDIAWFGGSRNDPSSRYDFLAIALIDSNLRVKKVDCLRIHLENHDLDAENTFAELIALIEKYKAADRIVWQSMPLCRPLLGNCRSES